MLNYKTWLETPNKIRAVLVIIKDVYVPEVDPEDYNLHISSHGLTVSGRQYLPVLNKLSIDESISLDYSPTINSGDIEINNSNGEYDHWINAIWINKTVTIYVGEILPVLNDQSLYLERYQQVFTGIVSDIDLKNRNVINLKIRDVLQEANTSISSEVLGNYYQGSIVPTSTYNNPYANNLKPVVYGEVNNITPLLIDPSTLQYMVNRDSVESIIEVRDNGVPVQFTVDPTYNVPGYPEWFPGPGWKPYWSGNNAGTFKLLKTPVGAVTCSVQGTPISIGHTYSIEDPYSYGRRYNTYKNTAANIISVILDKALDTFSEEGFDPVSFSTLGTQPVGVYITSRVNMLSLCQEIAKSCGLILTTNRYGRIRLVELALPEDYEIFSEPASSYPLIEEKDTIYNSLMVDRKLDVIAGVKVGYARNWTIQPSLLTSIPEQHKSLFSTEYLEALSKDAYVASNYKITTEPELDTGYLITTDAAQTVSANKLNLYKEQRKILKMTCTTKFLYLEPGDYVRLIASRFDISPATKPYSVGQVISTKPDWIRGTIELGVLV